MIAAAVARHTAAVVARHLGVLRPTLLSWLAGSGRPSTDDSIRGRAPLLATLDR